MAIISVQQLSKRYTLGVERHDTLRDRIAGWFKRGGRNETKSFWALKDVSFDVEKGDVIGVIGRNGAGKSTLLKILSQITEPTEGEVVIRGRVASLLEVGTGFHSELTGRENVFLNGAILGMARSEITRKFDEIATFAECDGFLDTPVKHYSSGMQMRLAFAVAAHLEPEILLVDEVLAVGDAAFQQKCLGKMGEVAQQGRTVLFVSHNMTAMSALCQRGVYLEKGALKQTGPIQEVIGNYMQDSLALGSGGSFSVEQRSGNGLAQITALSVSAPCVAGAPLRISLSYESKQPGQQVRFWIAVYDVMNARVLALDSGTIKDFPSIPPPRGTIEIELPQNVSLYPGRYTVNVAARVCDEMADFLQSALQFTVEEGDFFGTGKMPYGKAAVLVAQRWGIEATQP